MEPTAERTREFISRTAQRDFSSPAVRREPPILASTNTPDFTIEAQVRLLMKMLSCASVDIVQGYAAFTGGIEVTPEEERLLRMLYGVAHPE